MKKGTIYGIGLGPGKPELITLEAKRILDEADFVVIPQSDKTGRSVAGSIIEDFVPEDKRHWYHFPMTNNEVELAAKYDRLADDIAAYADAGHTVAYVTIGDASVYSTFTYLAKRLKRFGHDLVLCPGIPSFIAAANLANMPLVEKSENFCVIEMPEDAATLEQYARLFSTVVVMKVHKRLPALIEYVSTRSPKTAMLVKRAYLDGEEIIDLTTTTPNDQAGYLAIAIIKQGDDS